MNEYNMLELNFDNKSVVILSSLYVPLNIITRN